ncbi:MAG TPA: glutamate--tRNA ligase [Clostridiales bacterium]|nr:glutamate--tRNA ligase [Clostridiales bacterium]
MDMRLLAERLFPHITQTPEDIFKQYPKRQLPKGAMVTRIAPSPTGFMHLGNLFGAVTDERLAHQSGGIFYLRIEDTDQKRTVERGVEQILEVFSHFGLSFDEGATVDGEKGAYGPYYQSQRKEIYQVFLRDLVAKGKAYPCFASEEELAELRQRQEAEGANPGYYGKYAIWRDASDEAIEQALAENRPYVIRLRSEGDSERKIKHIDLIKGEMELTENDIDLVIMKSDGLPPYHFAHVIDDTLMGTTHVVRGEEWLPTLPQHLQLFETLGWKPPYYLHTAHVLKMEGNSKRKLSKRKDPELALEFYHKAGFPVEALLEYIMTILNSNYEDWRRQNPTAPYQDFPFSYKKMNRSGALFDMEKLKDISKNTLSRMTAEEVLDGLLPYYAEFDPDFASLLEKDKAYALKILQIGRGGAKPRKDLTTFADAKPYMAFFYDELFAPEQYPFPENVSSEDLEAILSAYPGIYDENDDTTAWFDKIRSLAEELGYAGETKAYKKNPDAFKGHVGDISMVLRVAITGKTNAPDLFAVMQILGKDRVIARINRAKTTLTGK